jgi:hypothetical protein
VMGDECLAWEATYETPETPKTGELRDEPKLLSFAFIKSKDALIKKDTYGMEPSDIKIELE